MPNKYITKANSKMLLQAVYEGDEFPNQVLKVKGHLSEFINENKAYVFMDQREELELEEVIDFVKKLAHENRRPYQIDLDSFSNTKHPSHIVLLLVTMALREAQDRPYNVKTRNLRPIQEIDLLLKENNKNASMFTVAEIIAKNVSFTRRLQDTPPNIANSQWLAQEVFQEAQKYPQVKARIFGRKEVHDMGMGLFLSVNKGSVYEPQMVVLEYTGDENNSQKTALVGKGITFDSGGYNLKGEKGMSGMKFDMSGAAAMAGSFFSAVEIFPMFELKKNLVAVLMFTDNRINGDASLPSAIYTSMSGLTVEVNNTDAEGRLVMADGITFAIEKLAVSEIIDAATLTGAAVTALGHTYSAIYANDDAQWETFAKAASHVKENVWRMPYHEEYLEDFLQTDLADLLNTDMSGNAGSAAAGMFLRQFSKNLPHIHCDIAGTATTEDYDNQRSALGTAAIMKTVAYYLIIK